MFTSIFFLPVDKILNGVSFLKNSLLSVFNLISTLDIGNIQPTLLQISFNYLIFGFLLYVLIELISLVIFGKEFEYFVLKIAYIRGSFLQKIIKLMLKTITIFIFACSLIPFNTFSLIAILSFFAFFAGDVFILIKSQYSQDILSKICRLQIKKSISKLN
jgi:hypothetical protein